MIQQKTLYTNTVDQNKGVNEETSETKKAQETPISSLITNNGQTPTSRSEPVKRRPRRDDSDKNYNESVALNDEVVDLFGERKMENNPSVSKHLSIQCVDFYLFINMFNLLKIFNYFRNLIVSHLTSPIMNSTPFRITTNSR